MEYWISEVHRLTAALWLMLPGIICGALAGSLFAWYILATTRPRLRPRTPHQRCPRCDNERTPHP